MIQYSNRGLTGGVIFQMRGSIIPSALTLAVPAGLVGVAINIAYEQEEEMMENVANSLMKASQLFGALGATLIFLIGFRVNKAYARFWDGTTLLNQMWGEWFDAASCLVAFSSLARKTKKNEVHHFRHTLIRLMSLIHCSALEEIAQFTDTDTSFEKLDIGGLEQPVLRYLKMCKFDPELDFNRVEVILHMIQTLVVHAQESGVLKIPPPILSRVFQTLSRGQVNLANCKKITSTLFPFPFAQMIGVLIMVYTAITPVIMAVLLRDTRVWTFVFTAVPVFGLWACNYVARELEMPFGTDANDLPLEDFQAHMNNSLLMLIRVETDLVANVHENAPLTYEGVKENISRQRPKDVCDGRTTIFAAEGRVSGASGPDDEARRNLSMLPANSHPRAPSVVPEVVAQPVVPVPPPEPAPPAPAGEPPVKLDTTDLEKTLARMMDVLTDRFTDLTTSTKGLADQVNQNTYAMSNIEKGQKAQGSSANRLEDAHSRDDPHMRVPPVAQGSKSMKDTSRSNPAPSFSSCAAPCRGIEPAY